MRLLTRETVGIAELYVVHHEVDWRKIDMLSLT